MVCFNLADDLLDCPLGRLKVESRPQTCQGGIPFGFRLFQATPSWQRPWHGADLRDPAMCDRLEFDRFDQVWLPVIDYLAWDSQAFGIKIGRIYASDAAGLDATLARAKQQSYRLLYLFATMPIDLSTTSQIRSLDVGGQVTYCKQLGDAPSALRKDCESSGVLLYPHLDPSEPLLRLAMLSGHLSRFRVDPGLPAGSFEHLYERWLRNNLEDKDSCRVYIVGSTQDPEGLLTATWKQDCGTIDLLAVRSDVQGRGIGSRLIDSAEQETMRRGLKTLLVKTQMVNEVAKHTYGRKGFIMIEAFYVYHVYL